MVTTLDNYDVCEHDLECKIRDDDGFLICLKCEPKEEVDEYEAGNVGESIF